MAYFEDADEVYATLGNLFRDITADPELGHKVQLESQGRSDLTEV